MDQASGAQTWSREKMRDVLRELAKLDDFDMLLIPESIATEYNIPFSPAKTLSFKEYLFEHRKATFKQNDGLYFRPSDGIVRPISDTPPVELIVCHPSEVDTYLIPETSSETPSSCPENSSSPPTEATETMPPLLSD
jgi:hypothetical protein